MLAAFCTQCEALQDEDETEGSLDSDESSDECSVGPLTENFEEKEVVRWRILIPMGDSVCQHKGP